MFFAVYVIGILWQFLCFFILAIEAVFKAIFGGSDKKEDTAGSTVTGGQENQTGEEDSGMSTEWKSLLIICAIIFVILAVAGGGLGVAIAVVVDGFICVAFGESFKETSTPEGRAEIQSRVKAEDDFYNEWGEIK